MMNNQDCAHVRRLGITAAKTGSSLREKQDAINEAVEFYNIADGESERRAVLFWWHEGVRDYADGQYHVDALVRALARRVSERAA